MIDKIYILNVQTETERRELCTHYLLEKGFPKNKIEVFVAKHWQDFTDKKELCLAAANEGIPLFSNLLGNNTYKECYQTYLAQTWSYMAFYKHIEQTRECAVLIHDDTKFNCTWTELVNALKALPEPENLLFAMLSTALNEGAVKSNDFIDKKSPWIKRTRELTWWDACILYTPIGCELLWEYVNHLYTIPLAWFMCAFNNKIFQHFANTYALLINPTEENRHNIEKIQDEIINNRYEHGWKYATCDSIPCLKTTIHDHTGAPIK